MNKLTRTLGVLGASATLALTGVAVIPAVAPLEVAQSSGAIQKAEAVNIYYFSRVKCVIGVYPVLSYLQWYKVRDYSYTEERAGWVDTVTWSHNDPPRYNIYYVGAVCSRTGDIVAR